MKIGTKITHDPMTHHVSNLEGVIILLLIEYYVNNGGNYIEMTNPKNPKGSFEVLKLFSCYCVGLFNSHIKILIQ
jgi:hypothetical protein